MSDSPIDTLVRAVLYEGYILYPYRRDTKNAHRWTFGGIFPRGFAGEERSAIQTQVLVRAKPTTKLRATLRFLQLVDRTIEPHDGLIVAGKQYQAWQEAVERCVSIDGIGEKSFAFPEQKVVEKLRETDGRAVGAVARTQSNVAGIVEISTDRVSDDLLRVTVRITNTSLIDSASARELALLQSMASANIVLSVDAGEFISAIDPPAECADLAKQCKNDGVWPVLVGENGAADTMLAAPIILYDYPQIAPQSPGDLFDGTEIDEILSLRIMTLSDEEKRAAADLDPRAAAILARTQSLAREEMSRLHGTMRPISKFRAGDRVRLKPKRNADAFDIILRGKTATIVAIEQDFENRIHLAVTIDDDPGADIGAAGKIGHRFFYGIDEVEPLAASVLETQ